jgi:hypothetical protein
MIEFWELANRSEFIAELVESWLGCEFNYENSSASVELSCP